MCDDDRYKIPAPEIQGLDDLSTEPVDDSYVPPLPMVQLRYLFEEFLNSRSQSILRDIQARIVRIEPHAELKRPQIWLEALYHDIQDQHMKGEVARELEEFSDSILQYFPRGLVISVLVERLKDGNQGD